MIFERQRYLLALLDAVGGSAGRLDFQKLLFLYCQEAGETAPYEFIPYKYGGFSFTSYADGGRLAQQGMLELSERSWTLTPIGRQAAKIPPLAAMRMGQFAQRYSALRGDPLVLEAYRRHPYYAVRSEIADRLLAGDSAAQAAVTSARPTAGAPGICTIGYEGRSQEGYLNCLYQSGVAVVCDVRANPLSRKFGFSKVALAKGCEALGIRYEHLPGLGIASEDRCDLHTQADYDALFAQYEQVTLPRQAAALELIRSWVEKGQRVALTCYERAPQQCHRHCVADALAREFGRTFLPRHL